MSRDINVVCSHEFKDLIKAHSKFEMDLGRRYTLRSETRLKVDIKDPFVADFYKEHGELIYRVGRIGAIIIYTYNSIPEDEVWVYMNGVMNIQTYHGGTVEKNPDRYVYSMVQMAEYGEKTID